MSVEEVLALLNNNEESFVVGGGEVYNAMLPYCGKAIITKVNASPEAAVFFPNLDNDESWELTEQSEEYSCEGLKYRFCTYARK